MAKHARNYRMKWRYFDYLRYALGMGYPSAIGVLGAIGHFEEWSGGRGFAAFKAEHASAYSREQEKLLDRPNPHHSDGDRLTRHLKDLRDFFKWLSDQHGYRRITRSDADYFSTSKPVV